MQWVRLDTAFPRNHKVLALLEERDGHRALTAYVCGLAYAGEQGTDGFVPRSALPFVHARTQDAARLVAVNLWHAVEGGWIVNGWAEFQPSTEETQARSVKAQIAARARWEKKRAADAQSNAQSNARSIAQPLPDAMPDEQSTDERTDALTKNITTAADISPFRDARTRAQSNPAATRGESA